MWMRGHLKLLHHRRAGISELLYFLGLIPLIAYYGALKRAHRHIFLQTLCKTTCETRAGSSTNWWCWSMPYYPMHCILYPIIGRKNAFEIFFYHNWEICYMKGPLVSIRLLFPYYLLLLVTSNRTIVYIMADSRNRSSLIIFIYYLGQNWSISCINRK